MMRDPGLIALIVGALAALSLWILAPLRRLPEEKGLTPLFSERCSALTTARVGFRFGMPARACRIALYDKWFVMDIGGPVLVKYESVAKIERVRRWFSESIRLHMGTSNLVATFYVRNPEGAAAIFRLKGVSVVQ